MLKQLAQRVFPSWFSQGGIPYAAGDFAWPSGGTSVDPMNAFRLTPVYRAVTLIASDIARLHSEIDDPNADSLWQNPSTYMSAFEFRRTMLLNALLWGNSFAVINRTVGGELIELLPALNGEVSLDLTTGVPMYRTTRYGTLPQESVLHVRAPGFSGIWGESPINLCRTSVSLLATQERMALNQYQNAGNPKIAIIHPMKLSPEAMQRIERDYVSRHSGSENAGRPLVMAEGVKVERISSTLDDTGLDAARKYSIADVCRIYGVPASYLSEDVGAAYGNMEWLSRMYVDSCLRQWMSAIDGEVLRKTAQTGSQMYWDVDDLIRPGMAEQMAALRTAVESGVMTRNEARDLLELDPLPGLDEPIVALNMGTGGGTTNIGTDTSAQGGTSNDFTA